jgi:hypothetical protein
MSVVVALTLPVVALMVNVMDFVAGVVTRTRAKAYRTSVTRPHNGTPSRPYTIADVEAAHLSLPEFTWRPVEQQPYTISPLFTFRNGGQR